MVYISPYCHSNGTGECLEDAFYLVVLVLSFGLDVEVDPCRIAEALEEMQEHFSGHLTNAFTMEFSIPDEPWTPAEVESNRA